MARSKPTPKFDTDKLAEFIVHSDQLPPAVIDAAVSALLDTIGVALMGTLEPASQIARKWVAEIDARPQATIWGCACGTSVAEAAYANGIASHVLDWDDTSVSLRGHPSATLIPTVLAVGEALHATGLAALEAFAVALEVAAKISRALGNSHFTRGWYNTLSVGVFSCAAAAGRLYGLDARRMALALGIAATQSAGLMRNFGTMTKAFHAGHASRCGIQAAWLANNGYSADETIFDGKDSYLATYSAGDGPPFSSILETLGSPWELVDPGLNFKRWPCSDQLHCGLIGLSELLDQNKITTDEIEAIALGFPPGSDAALLYDDPKSGREGKFSVHYTAAAYVLDRQLGHASYTEAQLARPEARVLMQKIRRYLVPDSESHPHHNLYTDVEIVTHRGNFTRRVQQAGTRAAWLITSEEQNQKFLRSALAVLSQEQAEQVLRIARDCPNLHDIAALTRATVPQADVKQSPRRNAPPIPAGESVETRVND